MADYEHDQFDDVPWDSSHRGAYRGDLPEKTGGFKHLAAVIVAGICALVIGGLLFLFSPKTAGPEAAGTSSSSSSSASASTSASSGDQASSSSDSGSSQADPSTTIGVYNYGSKEGTATKSASTLRDTGWTISDVSNWDGQAQNASVVYYAQGSDAQAKEIAKKLGIQDVRQSSGYTYDVVVVLAAHDAAGATGQ